MNFSLGYSTELEVFNISMIIERQREGIMLFLRSYNTHTIIYIVFMHQNVCFYHVDATQFSHPTTDWKASGLKENQRNWSLDYVCIFG